MLKSLILSNSDLQGGAARAAYRLHQGLSNLGTEFESRMLVQNKLSSNFNVYGPRTRIAQGLSTAKLTLDVLPTKLYKNRQKSLFSVQWLPDNVEPTLKTINPDVVNIHWIGEAFLQIETLKRIQCPIIWTLHDMWALTGGCHYDQGCERYVQSCGRCPILASQRERDLSHWTWWRKSKAWKHLNLTLVTPSAWLAKCAKTSSLFRDVPVEVIPNGICTDSYRPIDKQIARELLNLQQHKHLVCFGAMNAASDSRKGFLHLQKALTKLSQRIFHDDLEVVIFGDSKPQESVDIAYKEHYLGRLNDDTTLALAYSAADLFILPSTQENLANTIMEALSCGTPCVAFDIGGNSDLIDHKENGYLAKPYDVEDLAAGIIWILQEKTRYLKLSQLSRNKVLEKFSLDRQARAYSELFHRVIDRTP